MNTRVKRIILSLAALVILAGAIFAFVHFSKLELPAPGPSAASSQPTTEPPEAFAAQPIIEFNDGSIVQLISVHEHQKNDAWWGLDGSPLPGPTTRSTALTQAQAGPSERALVVHFRTHAAKDIKWRHFHFDAAGMAFAANYRVTTPTDGEGVLRVIVPKELQFGDLQIGQALGGWFTQVQADVKLAPTTQVSLRPVNNVEPAATTQSAHVSFGDVMYDKDLLKVEVLDARTPKQRMTTNWEIAALGTDSKRYRWYSMGVYGGKLLCLMQVPKDKVASVVYQTRRIEWHTLPNVAFQPRPGATTQPVPQL